MVLLPGFYFIYFKHDVVEFQVFFFHRFFLLYENCVGDGVGGFGSGNITLAE